MRSRRTRWLAVNPSLAVGGLAVVSLVFFAMGVRDTLRHERLRTDGRSTTATVTSAERSVGVLGSRYMATFTFQTADGATMTGEQPVSPRYFANLRGNDTRSARYLPEEPGTHELEGEYLANRAVMNAVAGLGGVLLAAGAVFVQARQARQG